MIEISKWEIRWIENKVVEILHEASIVRLRAEMGGSQIWDEDIVYIVNQIPA